MIWGAIYWSETPIETIFGNLQGLKSSHLKQLQRLYHHRIPGDRITTPEFSQRLAAISTEINQPVCAHLNRRGQVMRVGVGTPRQTQIPPLELPRYGAERLSGIRCIATHLREILTQMPVTPGLALVVFNKIDQADSATLALAREEFPLAVFISASQRLGLETLRQRLTQLVQYVVDTR
ncbi:hypothetical protein [Anabaenopsis sp. FSS-46]|uniref:hypothetical protein n=1 Tax=Anabaenopsis sp. FSS-46 TaxID=2971766 RepID=UPI0032AEA297